MFFCDSIITKLKYKNFNKWMTFKLDTVVVLKN